MIMLVMTLLFLKCRISSRWRLCLKWEIEIGLVFLMPIGHGFQKMGDRGIYRRMEVLGFKIVELRKEISWLFLKVQEF